MVDMGILLKNINSPTLNRVFHVFLVEFIMLSFPSCLYLPWERQLCLSEHLVTS